MQVYLKIKVKKENYYNRIYYSIDFIELFHFIQIHR